MGLVLLMEPSFLLMPWTIDITIGSCSYSTITELSAQLISELIGKCPGDRVVRLPTTWNCPDKVVRKLSIGLVSTIDTANPGILQRANTSTIGSAS